VFGGEEARYRDVRKLGGLWIARDAAELADIVGVQGPDAAAVSLAELETHLAGRRGAIKPLLMDQRVIAGLGNMLSDEILWNARIDPARRATTLSAADVRRLRNSVCDVTRRAVKAGRIPRTRSWLSSQRGDPDPVCPRCQGPIERRTISGRTSLWCPDCQH
jgi:formamidopyrimidine-DNA glycosylase